MSVCLKHNCLSPEQGKGSTNQLGVFFKAKDFVHKELVTLQYEDCNLKLPPQFKLDVDRHLVFKTKDAQKQCTALILTNLADPYYIVLGCSTTTLVNVMCHVPFSNEQPELETNLELHVCDQTAVQKNMTCFQFQWLGNLTDWRSKCHPFPQYFEYVFEAVQTTRFPPIIVDESVFVKFTRYHNMYSYSTHQTTMSTEGLCIMPKSAFLRQVGENIFENSLGEFMSVELVCHNEVNHTQGQNFITDPCTCSSVENISKTCKHILHPHSNKTCSPLYHKTASGECEVYMITSEHAEDDTQKKKSTKGSPFKCSNRKEVDRDLVGDLVEDCPNGRDEPVLNSMFIHLIYHLCAHSYQIPCREGHSRCFNVSQICTYNINRFMFLEPCRTGEHLQLCKQFSCNAMFKCPNYYCVPWKYVCNGYMDCPSGTDELNKMCAFRNCTQLYKCKLSQVCIHLGDVCDGKTDCPQKDDELVCSLNDAICPLGCVCLSVAVFCESTQIMKLHVNMMLPLTVVLLTKSKIHHQFFLPGVLILSVTFSGITEVCSWLEHARKLRSINVGFNRVEHVFVECFSHTTEVSLIDLNNNLVSTLKNHVFSSLPCLSQVNLSYNPLHTVADHTFSEVPNLQQISLLNVFSIKGDGKFMKHLNVEVVETNNIYLCCFLPQNAECSVNVPWYISCTRLLQMGVRVTFYIVSSSILILNSISVTLYIRNYVKRLEKSFAFTSNIVSINVGDQTCAVPLFILWVFDLLWMDNFILIQSKWRSSPLCFTVFGLFLCFNFLSVSLLGFFTLSRFIIVKFPMQFSMKKGNRVLKINAAIHAVCYFLACTFTLLTWLVDLYLLQTEKLSFMCSPYLDTSKKMVMTKVLTWLMTMLQFISILCIFVLYLQLYIVMKGSQESVKKAKSKQQSNTIFIVQLMVITMSNVMCWIPSGIVHMLSMFLGKYPVEILLWTVAVVNPLNSVINPFIFIILSLRKF